MLSDLWSLLKAMPINLPFETAGPPLFPGLIAASTWMRSLPVSR